MSNFNQTNKIVDSKNLIKINKYKLIKDYKSLYININKIKNLENETGNFIFNKHEQFDYDITKNIDNTLYQIEITNDIKLLKFYFIKLKIIRELLNLLFNNIKLLDFNKLKSSNIFSLANILYKLYYYTYIQINSKNIDNFSYDLNYKLLIQIFIILNYNRINISDIISKICLSLEEQKELINNKLNKELEKDITKDVILKVRDRVINFDIFHNYFNKNIDSFIKETEFIYPNTILKMKLDGNIIKFKYTYAKTDHEKQNLYIYKFINALTDDYIKLRLYIGKQKYKKYIDLDISYIDNGYNIQSVSNRNEYSFSFTCDANKLLEFLNNKNLLDLELSLVLINKVNTYLFNIILNDLYGVDEINAQQVNGDMKFGYKYTNGELFFSLPLYGIKLSDLSLIIN